MEDVDDPRIYDQPFNPEDLESDGDVKDSQSEKYNGEDQEKLKDRKSDNVDEFSAAGGGAIMGHMDNSGGTPKKKK